jgi:hypothetical protein
MTDKSYRPYAEQGEVGEQNRGVGGVGPGKKTLVEQAFGQVARSAASLEKPRPSANDALAKAAATSGQPLPTETRGKLETAAGADLSSVRIHDKPASAAAADAVGAHAYAVGQDIHFASGA